MAGAIAGESIDASWEGFIAALERDVLPIYLEHERAFDEPGIHGRLHVCRCVVFAEAMGRHYTRRTDLRPAMNDVRFAAAFHDAARRANGPDFWEHESAALCAEYARRHPARFSRGADGVADLFSGKAEPAGACIEARILHDADVLDIMRPCCGHGGREGFREDALIFLGERDEPQARDPVTRRQLIEEAWAFIRATEERKDALRASGHYFADVLVILHQASCPLLAEACGPPAAGSLRGG